MLKKKGKQRRSKAIHPMPQPGQIALSPREVCGFTGLSLRLVTKAIRDGSLPARQIGLRRRIVQRADAEAFVRSLPAARPEAR
ncbi:helix-turn-helix transcriptional regulator [Bradyrhizobium sp. HKCCYLRH3099]|uniref:helix-turn-helix transcriptional regulator n=1 Tax=unclassified Bradyrhizobium TaxID=2631580 RepID=UPI003EB93BB2